LREESRELEKKAVSGIMLTLLLIGMLPLMFDKALIAHAHEIIIDHKENFKIRDFWRSDKYENLPAGRNVTVSWKADLGIPLDWQLEQFS